jgi:predicted nucleotide-binding protein
LGAQSVLQEIFMAKKRFQTSEKLPPPSLLLPRATTLQKIQVQIDKGLEIRNKPINSATELEDARSERSKWSKYNSELLLRLFDNSSMADEYNRSYGRVIYMNASFERSLREFREGMDDSNNRLEAIRDRLDLIPELNNNNSPATISRNPTEILGQDIFIVHGHDEAAKESVSRFIEKLGFRTTILHEQPNAGRTIIEKFEEHSNVAFAVILLTPDDIGAAYDRAAEGKPRARQNVILELGYFIAKLGRQRVCALYKEEVELPSDIYGLLYIPLDAAGAWRLSLAREMKHAGFPLDMNKAI